MRKLAVILMTLIGAMSNTLGAQTPLNLSSMTLAPSTPGTNVYFYIIRHNGSSWTPYRINLSLDKLESLTGKDILSLDELDTFGEFFTKFPFVPTNGNSTILVNGAEINDPNFISQFLAVGVTNIAFNPDNVYTQRQRLFKTIDLGSHTNQHIDQLNYSYTITLTNNTGFDFATNLISDATLTGVIAITGTNGTGSSLLFTNTANSFINIGNWGTFYPGINTLYIIKSPHGLLAMQDTGLLSISIIDGLQDILNSINDNLTGKGTRQDLRSALTPEGDNSDDFMAWGKQSTQAEYRVDLPSFITMLQSFISGGGSAWYASGTGETTTNEVVNLVTNSIATGQSANFWAKVILHAPTNIYRYDTEIDIHKTAAGVVTSRTNDVKVSEPADTSPSVGWEVSGSDVILKAKGPTSGENTHITWSYNYRLATNHSADGASSSWVYLLNNLTGTVIAAHAPFKMTNDVATTNVVIGLRYSDGATNAFQFAANNWLDGAAVETWAAGSSVGLHTSYDQTGRGNHIIQTDTNLMFLVAINGVMNTAFGNSVYAYRGDGADDRGNRSSLTGLGSSADFGATVAFHSTTHVSGDTVVDHGSSTRGRIAQSSGNRYSFNSGSSVQNPAVINNGDDAIIQGSVGVSGGTGDGSRVNNNAWLTTSVGDTGAAQINWGSSTLSPSGHIGAYILMGFAIEGTGDADTIRTDFNLKLGVY